MEVYTTKGVIIMYPLALFAIMLILLDGYCCGAAVLVKTNTTFRCDGRLDECLIEDDLELEFLMNPYVSRLLTDPPKHSDPNNPSKPFFDPCGGSKAYATCIAEYKKNHHGCEPKDVYAAARGC